MPWTIILSTKGKIRVKDSEDVEDLKQKIYNTDSDFFEYDGQIFKKTSVMGLIKEDFTPAERKSKRLEEESRKQFERMEKANEAWRQEIDFLIQQTPEEKADWELRTWFPIFWILQWGNTEISESVKERAKSFFISFFSKNPNKWHCSKENYPPNLIGTKENADSNETERTLKKLI